MQLVVGPLPIMSKALGSIPFTDNKQIKFKTILEIKKQARKEGTLSPIASSHR